MDESLTSTTPKVTSREDALRLDLAKEYYAILEVVSAFDGRILTVKGWSVTLSLAALVLGFQEKHYALFGLAAATASAFYYIDSLLKGYQMRYYSRMRDIEVAAYHLNKVNLQDLGLVSAPRVDMSWGYYAGRGQEDWRTHAPQRRQTREIEKMMRWRYIYPSTLLPHIVAILLGTALFLAAFMEVPPLADLDL